MIDVELSTNIILTFLLYDLFYSKRDSSMAFYLSSLSYSESIYISWELDIDVMSIYISC